MMTGDYREENFEALRDSAVWGLCATDAFGMGMDLPDIMLVVQWKATCGLCALWQWFGHAARGPGQDGTALLIVEKKDTSEGREEKETRTKMRQAGWEQSGKATKHINLQNSVNGLPWRTRN
ncbi:hypothetical protein BDQ17DRAFT_1477865 [Cyathus striatus]|nr:hypothetical protein BDQ17DRAFT_1477865 [Cyathus striatus]